MEWIEIRNRPLIAIRAAGSNDVFKEMKVNCHECQDGGSSAVRPCGDPGQGCSHEGEDQVVPEEVVIFAPPKHRTGPVPSQELREDAETIEVRGNTCDDYDFSLAVREAWSRLGQAPPGQAMRDGIQGSGDSEFDSRPEHHGVCVLDVNDSARR
jgi:hypothetical protein